MKIKINLDIDEKYTEAEINIKSNKISDEISKLIEFLENENDENITVIKEDKIILIKPEDIFTIYGENAKVMVETNNDKFQIKLRLYEVEKKLSHLSFIRISKSEIINIKNVKYFESSFTGILEIVFKNGKKTYVSRRYVKSIKERLGV